jgi:hypothetical protein
MIAMRLQLPTGQSLPCCLTFVDKARAAINGFFDSVGFIRPKEKDIEVNLTATDCVGRYLYVSIINEDDGQAGDPFPKIVRFLTREAALLRNPELAKITLREQSPGHLEIVN